MFTVVALGPVACYTNGTGSQLTTINIEGIILYWCGYNAFNVYCRELAPGTGRLTGDRAQGDDSKHCAYSSISYF